MGRIANARFAVLRRFDRKARPCAHLDQIRNVVERMVMRQQAQSSVA